MGEPPDCKSVHKSSSKSLALIRHCRWGFDFGATVDDVDAVGPSMEDLVAAGPKIASMMQLLPVVAADGANVFVAAVGARAAGDLELVAQAHSAEAAKMTATVGPGCRRGEELAAETVEAHQQHSCWPFLI